MWMTIKTQVLDHGEQPAAVYLKVKDKYKQPATTD